MAFPPTKFVALEEIPVTLPVSGPENPVALKIPVEGTKDRAPEVVFCGRFPVLAVTQVGYTAVAVAASLVMAVLVAFVAFVAEAAEPSMLVIPVRASAPDAVFRVTAVVPIYIVEELAALSPVLVPEIVASAVVVKFPPSLTVLAALTTSNVRVRPVVSAVDEVPAMVTS